MLLVDFAHTFHAFIDTFVIRISACFGPCTWLYQQNCVWHRVCVRRKKNWENSICSGNLSLFLLDLTQNQKCCVYVCRPVWKCDNKTQTKFRTILPKSNVMKFRGKTNRGENKNNRSNRFNRWKNANESIFVVWKLQIECDGCMCIVCEENKYVWHFHRNDCLQCCGVAAVAPDSFSTIEMSLFYACGGVHLPRPSYSAIVVQCAVRKKKRTKTTTENSNFNCFASDVRSKLN